MNEIESISTDKYVIELIELLKKNQMEREAVNVADLVSYIDVLQSKVDMMSKQLDEVNKELSHVKTTQDKTLEVKLNRAEERLEEGIARLSAYMVSQTKLRIEGLQKSISATKKFIVSKAKEIVEDTKRVGKKALFKVSELLRVRHVLAGMKNSVEIGIQETNDFISRIDDFGEDMRAAKKAMKAARDERKNAIRNLFGKEPKGTVEPESGNNKISRIEIAKKPWHWQRGVYESIKHFLDTSIEQLDKLQDSVLSSIKEAGVKLENTVGNDFGVDERIFSAEEILPVAVVAEDKNQYGADAFEEYMKNDAVEADAPVTETHSLNAPKAPKR